MFPKDSVQYSFRLNLKNPDHLLIYQTLNDLNLDIHKSISSFTVESLRKRIKGELPENLTYMGKKEAEVQKESVEDDKIQVLRNEMNQMKEDLAQEVTNRVLKSIVSLMFSSYRPSGDQIEAPRAETGQCDQNEHKDMDTRTEQVLSELTDLWS